MRLVISFLLFLLSCSSFAQLRFERLELKPKEVFHIKESDIIVIDVLIMHDSSTIVLNHDKKDNFIHTKKIIVGKGCRIDGLGENGVEGKPGVKGSVGEGPCRDGYAGRDGTGGSHGSDGINLFLYFNEMVSKDKLQIDLRGGNGGDGGKGGEGGGGSPGTRVCQGGTGGDGGNGSTGGNGGNGGTLTLSCKNCTDLRMIYNESLNVSGYGGIPGLGGMAGQGGQAGLNPVGNNTLDGKVGSKGKPGQSGVAGKRGAVNLEQTAVAN